MKKTFFEESQGIAMGAIGLMLIMFICDATPSSINKRWEKDAVEKGHGEWVVDPDGDTNFQWKAPVAKPVADSNPLWDSLNAGPPPENPFPEIIQ